MADMVEELSREELISLVVFQAGLLEGLRVEVAQLRQGWDRRRSTVPPCRLEEGLA